nr:3483_t:CDS:2 [Entrophospora candida]
MNTQRNNAEGTSGPTSKGGTIKKKELCEYKRDNPYKSHETIAELFEINANKKRDSGGGWPQLEEALSIWVNLANEANCTITGAILSQKTAQFAQRLNISDFKSSHMFEEDEEMRPSESEYLLEDEDAVQLLINQLNVDGIAASNYINIDSRIENSEIIDDEEIIAAVQEAPEE